MPRAVLSVHDKTGIVEFAGRLARLGWEIVSSGGTARTLREAGVPVVEVAEVTGFPEILGGRVKTLHPAILAAILARRDVPGDLQALHRLGIQPVDLVCVNLYPFEETVARTGVTFAEAIEQVDVGGPTMLRAAAKNHDDVIVVCDPADYEPVLAALEAGGLHAERRRALAAKVFARTAAYDAAITQYLEWHAPSAAFPRDLVLALRKVQDLRYGENPDQGAAFYAPRVAGRLLGLRALRQHQGKELSYNNLLDLDGALLALAPFAESEGVACAILKHTTPCGIAVASTPVEAYGRALAADPTSAFGSVIGFTKPVDADAATALADLFVECLVAPALSADAMERLAGKKNLRILTPGERPTDAGDLISVLVRRGHTAVGLEIRGVAGGVLAQSTSHPAKPEKFRSGGYAKVVTRRAPTEAGWADLAFAWAAVWSVKSNAILLARDRAAIGIGAGQMSRVDASRIAVMKARDAGHDPKGAVLASDAFFPFRDGVDAAAKAGISAIAQPGGSVRDDEVIAAADEHGIAMIFTGRRLFRH